MYRYTKEELSTSSSEDEISTTTTGAEAAAAAAAVATTADMCRVKVRNGKKIVVCNGCGYESDRRANVTRHYGRIHAELKPKKFRECPCGTIFRTKDQFYDHCEEYHPNLRQSSYTTTHVYKMHQTKARRIVKNPYAKLDESSQRPQRQGRIVTRASARQLRSNGADSSSVASCNTVSDSSGIRYPGASFNSAGYSSSNESSGATFSGSSSRKLKNNNAHSSSVDSCSAAGASFNSAGYSSSNESSGASFRRSGEELSFEYSLTNFDNVGESTRMELAAESFSDAGTTFSNNSSAISSSTDSSPGNEPSFSNSEAEDISDENVAPNLAPLPIKKRYLQSYKRRVFRDITNSNVKVQKVNDLGDMNNDSSRQMSIRELYLSNLDESVKSYLRDVDFDELSAVLQLQYLKKEM